MEHPTCIDAIKLSHHHHIGRLFWLVLSI